jgi:hypothetical protein
VSRGSATIKLRHCPAKTALQTPETLAAYQQAEIEKWWPIIKAANIKGE